MGLLDGLRLNANDNVEDGNNSGGGAAEDSMEIDTRGELGVDDGKKSAMDDSVHFDTGGNDMEEEDDMEVEDEAVGNGAAAAAAISSRDGGVEVEDEAGEKHVVDVENDVSCVMVCCIV